MEMCKFKNNKILMTLKSEIKTKTNENINDVEFKELENETINHFELNDHIQIKDAEDILRMFYFWYQQLAILISLENQHENFETLKLKYLVTPQRHKMNQMVKCKNNHTSNTNFIILDFVCLQPMETFMGALNYYFRQ